MKRYYWSKVQRNITSFIFRALLCFAFWLTMPWLAFADTIVPAGTAPVWVTAQVVAPKVSYRIFQSAAVGGPVSYHVYIPDRYASEPERRFPVLYYLHGSDSVLTGISTVSALFDQAIATGRIPPMLIVFPNGLPYGMWCNAASGLLPVESMVMNDLVPEIDRELRTIADRRARLVEGFSMGGYGAARFALTYPNRFAGASMLAAGPLQLDFLAAGPNFQPIALRQRILAEVYGNSLVIFEAASPWRLAEAAPNVFPPTFRLRQVIGTADFTLQPNRDFQGLLVSIGMSNAYVEVTGIAHAMPALVQAMGASFWSFHRDALRDADVYLRDGFEGP